MDDYSEAIIRHATALRTAALLTLKRIADLRRDSATLRDSAGRICAEAHKIQDDIREALAATRG